MRIVHTSDWHIGKLVHGIHMTEDQRYMLDKFLELLEECNPDVLIISGDIYDRSVPPTEAIKLLDNIFAKILVKLQIKIIAIAGNHDNPDRLGFASEILKERGLYIISNIEQALKPIILNDEHGEVAFFSLPYLDPATIRRFFDDQEVKTHQDGLEKILGELNPYLDSYSRKVAIYHGYVRGFEELLESESERPLSLGGSDVVNVDLFSNFDYTALGHLHGLQKVKYDKVRYAGSLLKYSFSEHLQKKGFIIVDLAANGQVSITIKSLSPMRDMRRIKGKLEDLISYSEESDDYIEATITDKGELIDPIGKLRLVYPNTLSLIRERYESLETKQSSASDGFVKMHPLELFEDFYQNIMGNNMPKGSNRYLEEIWEEIEAEKRLG